MSPADFSFLIFDIPTISSALLRLKNLLVDNRSLG